MNTIKHATNGREYEIRSSQTAEGWELAVFHGRKRIPLRCTVSFAMAQDLQSYYGGAIEALIDWVKRSLDDGMLEVATGHDAGWD